MYIHNWNLNPSLTIHNRKIGATVGIFDKSWEKKDFKYKNRRKTIGDRKILENAKKQLIDIYC